MSLFIGDINIHLILATKSSKEAKHAKVNMLINNI